MKSLTDQMIDEMMPVFYDFFLKVGEEGVIKHIKESGVSLKLYPEVAKRIEQSNS